jgi:hypothetical protein
MGYNTCAQKCYDSKARLDTRNKTNNMTLRETPHFSKDTLNNIKIGSFKRNN